MPPRVIVTEGLPLSRYHVDQPYRAENRRRCRPFLRSSSTFGENVDRLGRPLHSLDEQERQVGAEIVGVVGGDEMARQRLLFLRPLAASKDDFELGLASLGHVLGRDLREVHDCDVSVGRHQHCVGERTSITKPVPDEIVLPAILVLM